jgi:hypothetical protein
MKLSGIKTKTIVGFILAAILSAPAFGASTPLPGTLNYVEGEARIGSQELNAKSVGSSDLQAGEIIATEKGRVEVLLTPGVFLRLDNNSAAEMISPSLTNTEVQLNKGRAMLEVADIHKQNDIKIAQDGATTQVLKNGLYAFDANTGEVQVFDGKAEVSDKAKTIDLKGGRELNVASDAPLKPQKFDKKKDADDFYNWSALRSQYESEANMDIARYAPGVVSPGWFWDPWYSAYTFVPGNGIFYSPFGWGFYSPAWFGYAPIYYGAPYHYYRPGYYGHGHYDHPHTVVPRGEMRAAPAMHAQGGFGGFHGGVGRR